MAGTPHTHRKPQMGQRKPQRGRAVQMASASLLAGQPTRTFVRANDGRESSVSARLSTERSNGVGFACLLAQEVLNDRSRRVRLDRPALSLRVGRSCVVRAQVRANSLAALERSLSTEQELCKVVRSVRIALGQILNRALVRCVVRHCVTSVRVVRSHRTYDSTDAHMRQTFEVERMNAKILHVKNLHVELPPLHPHCRPHMARGEWQELAPSPC